MTETILNIYLVIENGSVISFKAKPYKSDGDDKEKISFLKRNARDDFKTAKEFAAPKNKNEKLMEYKKFAKLERQGMQYKLFEEIFAEFQVPEKPLICVTPVVDGKIFSS